MKKALTLSSFLALAITLSAQNEGDKYEKVFRENDKGEMVEDSILYNSHGLRVETNQWGARSYYDSEGTQVTNDGKHIIIYRETEDGNMVQDSVPK
ncbi:MAG: hypothetical protein RH916_05020 [Vicingaceae bacterium]